MLSIVVTLLLFIVALLIVLSLILGAKREHQRLLRTSTFADSVATTAPILPSAWYTRRRILISFGFLVMVVLTFFFQNTLTEGTLQSLSSSLKFSLLNNQFDSHTAKSSATSIVSSPLTASERLVRVDSSARNQYYNDYQWQVWSYSSCSGIAMEMVMNAYGRHFIAADVLQEELNLGVWDVNLGLLREDGIIGTATYFGFNTSETHTRTLQNILAISNQGTPVIVSVRDSYYFPGGHIFVIRGGDSANVYIADSSPHNFQRMSYSMFLSMWQGFSATLIPR